MTQCPTLWSMLSAGRVYQPVSHVRMYILIMSYVRYRIKMVPAPRGTRESERIRPMQPNPTSAIFRLSPAATSRRLITPTGKAAANCLQFTHRLRRLAAVSRDGICHFREPDHVARLPNLTGFPSFCCGFAMGYGTQASRAGPSPHVIRMQASIEVSPKRNRRWRLRSTLHTCYVLRMQEYYANVEANGR